MALRCLRQGWKQKEQFLWRQSNVILKKEWKYLLKFQTFSHQQYSHFSVYFLQCKYPWLFFSFKRVSQKHRLLDISTHQFQNTNFSVNIEHLYTMMHKHIHWTVCIVSTWGMGQGSGGVWGSCWIHQNVGHAENSSLELQHMRSSSQQTTHLPPAGAMAASTAAGSRDSGDRLSMWGWTTTSDPPPAHPHHTDTQSPQGHMTRAH